MAFVAPDGRTFATRDELRQYARALYSFEGKQGEVLAKPPGSIRGQVFNVADLQGCTVLLLDWSEHVYGDNLVNCKLFIGPASGSVHLRNCRDCDIVVATKQLRLTDCVSCRLFIHSHTDPAIEGSHSLRLAAHVGQYEQLQQHFVEATLDPGTNLWFKVFDFNEDDESVPRPRWTRMDPAEQQEAAEWLRGHGLLPSDTAELAPSSPAAAGAAPAALESAADAQMEAEAMPSTHTAPSPRPDPSAAAAAAAAAKSPAYAAAGAVAAADAASGGSPLTQATFAALLAAGSPEEDKAAAAGGASLEVADSGLHLIEGDPPFSMSKSLEAYLRAWGVADAGKRYGCVAIFGCQSSGKSTLLNLMFGCRFQEMHAEDGRKQTTRGVWLDKSHTEASVPLIVMDLEGTDSRERADSCATFERQSALFAMVAADVLIINLWYNDVGRHTAANYELLRTILQANFNLVPDKDARKTTLLFVIRDYPPKQTPLETVAATLRTDMTGMFEEIHKPERFHSTTLDDFFQLQFVALASKVFCEEDFLRQVAQLRQRFLDYSAPDALIPLSRSARVPGDGLAQFSSDIWGAIQSKEELNVPSHKQLLAVFHCNRVADLVEKGAQPALTALRKRVAAAVESSDIHFVLDLGFGAYATDLLTTCLHRYDERTKLYERTTVLERRLVLHRKLSDELLKMARDVLQHASTQAQARFEHAFQPKLRTLLFNFKAEARTTREMAERLLNDVITRTLPSDEVRPPVADEDDETWQHVAWQARRDLANALHSQVRTARAQQLRQVQPHLQAEIMSLGARLEEIMVQVEHDMWQNVGTACDRRLTVALVALARLAEALDMPDEDQQRLKAALVRSIENVITQTASTVVRRSALTNAMAAAFDDVFARTPAGVPRTSWKDEREIERLYIAARNAGLGLLERFVMADVNLPSVNLTLHLQSITPADRQLVNHAFLTTVEARFTTATTKLAASRVRPTAVPNWAWLLVAVLGLNEFWMLLTNPGLLVLSLGLLAFLFFTGRLPASLSSVLSSLLSRANPTFALRQLEEAEGEEEVGPFASDANLAGSDSEGELD